MNASDAIEEWAAGNRAMFERMYETLARADEKAARLTMTVTSADDGVEVVVGADKLVREIRIDEKAYKSYDEKRLAQLILGACQHAKKSVSDAQWQVIDAEFGVTK